MKITPSSRNRHCVATHIPHLCTSNVVLFYTIFQCTFNVMYPFSYYIYTYLMNIQCHYITLMDSHDVWIKIQQKHKSMFNKHWDRVYIWLMIRKVGISFCGRYMTSKHVETKGYLIGQKKSRLLSLVGKFNVLFF